MKKFAYLVFCLFVAACATFAQDAKTLQADVKPAETCLANAVIKGLLSGSPEATIVDAAIACGDVTLTDVEIFVGQLEDAGTQKVLAEVAKRKTPVVADAATDTGGQ